MKQINTDNANNSQVSDVKVSLDDFAVYLENLDELKPIENPDSILGSWFFVHKV